MTERARTLQLAKGLEAQGLECYPFYDQARGVLKPFDLCACCRGGLFWAIETKQMEVPSWESKACLLGPRSFRPHQLPNLLRVAEQGGRASVVLFVVPPRAVETRAWIVSARGIAQRFERDQSYRLNDFLNPESERYELVRLSGGAWGLGGALRSLFARNYSIDSMEEGWRPDLEEHSGQITKPV